MNWYYISNTTKADPAFLQCKARQVRGLGTVIQADSVADVLKVNNAYARGQGRLTAADVYGMSGRALETVLRSVDEARKGGE